MDCVQTSTEELEDPLNFGVSDGAADMPAPLQSSTPCKSKFDISNQSADYEPFTEGLATPEAQSPEIVWTFNSPQQKTARRESVKTSSEKLPFRQQRRKHAPSSTSPLARSRKQLRVTQRDHSFNALLGEFQALSDDLQLDKSAELDVWEEENSDSCSQSAITDQGGDNGFSALLDDGSDMIDYMIQCTAEVEERLSQEKQNQHVDDVRMEDVRSREQLPGPDFKGEISALNSTFENIPSSANKNRQTTVARSPKKEEIVSSIIDDSFNLVLENFTDEDIEILSQAGDKPYFETTEEASEDKSKTTKMTHNTKKREELPVVRRRHIPTRLSTPSPSVSNRQASVLHGGSSPMNRPTTIGKRPVTAFRNNTAQAHVQIPMDQTTNATSPALGLRIENNSNSVIGGWRKAPQATLGLSCQGKNASGATDCTDTSDIDHITGSGNTANNCQGAAFRIGNHPNNNHKNGVNHVRVFASCVPSNVTKQLPVTTSAANHILSRLPNNHNNNHIAKQLDTHPKNIGIGSKHYHVTSKSNSKNPVCQEVMGDSQSPNVRSETNMKCVAKQSNIQMTTTRHTANKTDSTEKEKSQELQKVFEGDIFLTSDLLKMLDSVESANAVRKSPPRRCTPEEVEQNRLEAKKRLENKMKRLKAAKLGKR